MYEDFIQPLLVELIPLAVTLIAAFFGYGVLQIKKFLAAQLASDELVWFKVTVEEYVRYLEQEGIKVGWTGAEKYDFAFTSLRHIANELNVDISDDEIKRAIEAFVQAMNTEKQVITVNSGPQG